MEKDNFRGAVFLVLFFFAGITAAQTAGALEFSYRYRTGDKYRIVSSITEDIFVNRELSYRAEILMRTTMETGAVSGGLASHSATFQLAEKTVSLRQEANGETAPFRWSRDYNSEFERDESGVMTIDDGYYMPMVRNVPVFPDRDLNPGDVWEAGGEEVHDFRDSFGIEQPYRIPFTASYTYLGEREWKGQKYPAFSVSYRVFLEPEPVQGKTFPLRIISASDQIVYWNTDHGQAAAYEEYFRTILDLSDGQTWEYRGKAGAEIIEAPPMDKEETAREIEEEISGMENATVRVTGEGVVISLENIQFAPDSPVLLPAEISKLDKIAEILMRYPNRDILIGGHTALAGTEEGRRRLSVERAQAVADYLLGENVRTPERIVVRGYGAEEPLADNGTEEGMMRNRRVEITILEN